MTLRPTIISEIHRTSSPEVGFLEGETNDGRKVYVRYKYGRLDILTGRTIRDVVIDYRPIFSAELADGGYHITDRELVDATRDADIRWPQGFGNHQP